MQGAKMPTPMCTDPSREPQHVGHGTLSLGDLKKEVCCGWERLFYSLLMSEEGPTVSPHPAAMLGAMGD